MVPLLALAVLKLCRLASLGATCYLVAIGQHWWAGIFLVLFIFGIGENRPPAPPAVKA